MIKIIGMLIVSYAMIISIFAGPEITSKGFKNRVVEYIDKYRNVLLLSLIGSIMMGIS